MKNVMKKIYSIFGIIFILAAFVFRIDHGMYIVSANEATTYTKTYDADGRMVNSQNGYYPGATYDRIGLVSPKDIALIQEEINNELHDIAYILDSGNSETKPFILRVDLTDNVKVLNKYDLSFISEIKSPTGITIQKVYDDEHLNGIYKVYICDNLAKKTALEKNEAGAFYEYSGLIFVMTLDDLKTNNNVFETFTEPTEVYTNSDGNKIRRKLPAFGLNTAFSPVNIAVDSAGTMYIASKSTSPGMIQMSASGEFIGFFVVNSVQQDLIYKIVKFFNNKEQLELLEIKEPPAFTNVFINDENLVYSVTMNHNPMISKHATDGRSLFSLSSNAALMAVSDIYVNSQEIVFAATETGIIFVLDSDGSFIYMFGMVNTTNTSSTNNINNIAGFFSNLVSIVVDSQDRIWVLNDDEKNKLSFMQSFIPTTYTNEIFRAITSFNNHDYEDSRKAWEEVLQYDSLSVLANDGLGKAYYYDGNFEEAAKYFAVSKNRELYSESYWEIRNAWTSEYSVYLLLGIVGIIVAVVVLKYLFRKVKPMQKFADKSKTFFGKRFFADLSIGFRLLKKPSDTYYELKTGVRGSVLGATIYYVLGLVAILLYTYGKALIFQYASFNNLNVAIVLLAYLIIVALFVLSNYLVSSISSGEGTFINIYKFTGYSLLPIIVCLPIATGVSYALTLTEEVILDGLYLLAIFGTAYMLLFGILETHNFTFKKTIGNVVLTLVGILLIAIVILVVFVMFDQMAQLIEGIWKEVKLRAGWY